MTVEKIKKENEKKMAIQQFEEYPSKSQIKRKYAEFRELDFYNFKGVNPIVNNLDKINVQEILQNEDYFLKQKPKGFLPQNFKKRRKNFSKKIQKFSQSYQKSKFRGIAVNGSTVVTKSQQRNPKKIRARNSSESVEILDYEEMRKYQLVRHKYYSKYHRELKESTKVMNKTDGLGYGFLRKRFSKGMADSHSKRKGRKWVYNLVEDVKRIREKSKKLDEESRRRTMNNFGKGLQYHISGIGRVGSSQEIGKMRSEDCKFARRQLEKIKRKNKLPLVQRVNAEIKKKKILKNEYLMKRKQREEEEKEKDMKMGDFLKEESSVQLGNQEKDEVIENIGNTEIIKSSYLKGEKLSSQRSFRVRHKEPEKQRNSSRFYKSRLNFGEQRESPRKKKKPRRGFNKNHKTYLLFYGQILLAGNGKKNDKEIVNRKKLVPAPSEIEENVNVCLGIGNNAKLVKSHLMKRKGIESSHLWSRADFCWSQNSKKKPKISKLSKLSNLSLNFENPEIPNNSKLLKFFFKEDSLESLYKSLKDQKLFKIDESFIKETLNFFEQKKVQKVKAMDHSNLKMINHFEGMHHIGKKHLLALHIQHFCKAKKLDPKNYIPFTLIISNLNEIEKNMAKLEANTCKIWIVKPGENSNRGKGISLAKNTEEIKAISSTLLKRKKTSFVIVQEYIEKPLLFKGRKFDLRCYALAVKIGAKFCVFWVLLPVPGADPRSNPCRKVRCQQSRGWRHRRWEVSSLPCRSDVVESR
jgi:hypothetical protein